MGCHSKGVDVIEDYHEMTRLIERLHRRFLDVLRAELTLLEVTDINAVQALLLANIGDEEINVRELMSRGYYQGSNASYNLKKLVEMGYLIQEKSERDRRATMIRLSEKGLSLIKQLSEAEDKQTCLRNLILHRIWMLPVRRFAKSKEFGPIIFSMECKVRA